MIRVSGVLKSLALAACVGVFLPAALAQAQNNQGDTTYAADGSYTVTDPATGDVYYYDASGNLQYYTAIDPATGSLAYFYPDGTILDPLHGICSYAAPNCVDSGVATPVGVSKPNFTFVSSPSGATGNFYVDILVPSNEISAGAAATLVYDLTVNGGPTTVTSTYAGEWTSGDLTTFLGRSTSPPNPFGAWLPFNVSSGSDPSANGDYFVYDVNIGTATLDGTGPTLGFTTGSPGLYIASVIVGFLEQTDKKTGNPSWISTAQSAALFFDAPVPEPATIVMLLGGLLGMAFMLKRPGRVISA